MTVSKIEPFCLKDAPSLIEKVIPTQKLSSESYKEQSAVQSKTLTALGSYWKGRKPLVLNKACILGCLLPATSNSEMDLEIFELLMGMDHESMKIRLGLDKNEEPSVSTYSEQVSIADRYEELPEEKFSFIWPKVNKHLGTSASSFNELVEQLGIMRFGHRPKFADTFSGSGQIPFEAARLGCDVTATDLNPVACMLTWGAFNMVGASAENREKLSKAQKEVAQKVQGELDRLEVETDGNGWRPKVYLYCLEVICPQTGWKVPMLSTLLLSKGKKSVLKMVPDVKNKRFKLEVVSGVCEEDLKNATTGTIRSDGRGQEPYLAYSVNNKLYKTKISTLRGDYKDANGIMNNNLRQWEKSDFLPRETDIFQERLYAIQWSKDKSNEFRTVTNDDLKRELTVINTLKSNFTDWQKKGFIPDIQIEKGDETERLYRERGWTHWHHLFSPRQILFLALTRKAISELNDHQEEMFVLFGRLIDWSSKLCRYGTGAARESVAQTFYNQALNPFFNYGVRPFNFARTYLLEDLKSIPIKTKNLVETCAASDFKYNSDFFITDPPYGDAVKYEEITEFFIAWLRKNPPPVFQKWVWDSRRTLAIKGEDEAFRKGMVDAYSQMTKQMSDNGIQVIMFTHQSGSIWADMANIVWASGLQVTAAWYIVTETDSALRDGSYVKGTVLLVLRKRTKIFKTTRDDLAWEIQEEVERQVNDLTGLNQTVKNKNRDVNVFEDADLQMAGYAAALRVLTKYSVIDGREMMTEAIRPRVKGEATFVDSLIEFAVATANQALVPTGIAKNQWEKLLPAERFILKMTDLEIRGVKTLDNYQNFAKAFKVRDFTKFMQSSKANDARLKSAVDFGKTELTEGSELHFSTLRAIYFAMMEIIKEVDTNEILQHLSFNVKDYYSSGQQRELALALAQYLGSKLDSLRPEEASAARVLSELIRNQRLG